MFENAIKSHLNIAETGISNNIQQLYVERDETRTSSSAEFLFLEEVQRCTGCAEVSHASDRQLHGTLHQQAVLSEVKPT